MILYYFYRFIESILMLLPQSWRRGFFIILANIAYRIDSKHRFIIAQNLRFAFDNALHVNEEEAISRYCYRNLMLAFCQVMENRYLSAEGLAAQVTFENREVVDNALHVGKKIVFVSAHLGNWEVGAVALSRLVVPTVAVYKPLKNRWFDRYLLESRLRQNIEMVEKKGAVRHLAKALKAGKTVSLLIDQNANRREGVQITFFGKMARQSAAAAFLARKYDAVIIPLFVSEQNDSHVTIKFYDPIEVAQSDDSERDILEATQKQSDLLEAVIRQNPKLWFWCHRRWRTEHSEIYKRS